MFRGQKIHGMRRTLTICVAAGMLTGCTTKGGKPAAAKPGGGDAAAIIDPDALPKPEARYRVSTDLASFFRFSPQQPAGADQQLKKDMRVTLVGKLAGYSKVELPSGQFGYVDSADITHLSPKEISDEDALYAAQHAPPALLNTPMTDANLGNGGNIGNGGNYNPPPEAGRAQPLPLADPAGSPTPPPASIFRY